MADATPSRLGADNQGSDKKALFLKQFSGEVLAAFNEANAFMRRTMVRTISSGKSAQFPATGKASASYHTPGAELTGDSINHSERVITIDDLLVSDQFISNIDEAMNHYDVRREYSTQAGRALAKEMDTNLARVIALAARASATVTGLSGGSQIELGASGTTSSGGDTLDASELIAGISLAAQKLDEKDVPEEDRVCALTPAHYYTLASSDNDAINRDTTEGVNGGVDSGNVYRVAGIPIVKTTRVPQSNVTSGPSAYQGDFSETEGLVWHRSAAGTVKLIDLASEMDYQVNRQGTLLVSKLAVGHGILRPESAVELQNAET